MNMNADENWRRFRIEEGDTTERGNRASAPKRGKPKPKREDDDPVAEFHAAVKAKREAGLAHADALAAVVRERPALHARYVAHANRRNPEIAAAFMGRVMDDLDKREGR